MKKYTIFLVTLVLLTSCGTQTPVIENSEVTNELPQVEAPSDTLGEIQQETENLEKSESTENIPLSSSEVIELKQTYNSPAGEEYVGFRINMNGQKIESVDVTPILTQGDISEKRIAAFAEGINDTISGKTLAEAENISIVGGSSLTTGAFKEALKNM